MGISKVHARCDCPSPTRTRPSAAELLGWLDAHPPPVAEERADPRQSSADRRPWAVTWQRTLFDNGYLVPGWPPELGGRNANAAQQMIYFEEFTRREIRRTTNPQGLSIVTPSIIDYGTPEQRERWALPTLRAEISWCLGMSEPNAGSDLASLTTRAVADGDQFVVNGQKVWTSGAQHADWCFCFVRTDPNAPKHKGISVLVIDMRTPGIEYRPIAELTEPDVRGLQRGLLHRRRRARGRTSSASSTTAGACRMGSLAHERAMLWINYAYDLGMVVDHLVALGNEREFDARQRDVVASVVDRPARAAVARLPRLRQVRQGRRIARALDPQAVRKRVAAACARSSARKSSVPTASISITSGPPVWRTGTFVDAVPAVVRRRRSPAAPVRSSATSSPSGFWGCRVEDRCASSNRFRSSRRWSSAETAGSSVKGSSSSSTRTAAGR